MNKFELMKMVERDAKVLQALHFARYDMVVNNGLKVYEEGQEITLDFEDSIRRIDDAMRLLGFDPAKEVMIAPRRLCNPNPDEENHG